MGEKSGQVSAAERAAGENPQQIRAQIEQTRDDLSETIDAIQNRLSPRNLVEQAKDTVRDATVGKVKEMASSVSDTASDMADSTMEVASDVADRVRQNPWPAAALGLGAAWLLLKGVGSSTQPRRYYEGHPDGGRWRDDPGAAPYSSGGGGGMVDALRDNPVPAALAGLGLGWLAMKAGQGSSSTQFRSRDDWRRPARDYAPPRSGGDYGSQRSWGPATDEAAATYDRAKDAVSDVAGRAQELVSDTVTRTQERVGQLTYQAKHQAGDLLDTNPLILGAVAVVVGMAVGLSLPETEQENRIMGETCDSLVERAQGVAQTAVSKAKDVASDAAQTAVAKVKDVASEAGQTAVSQVKNAVADANKPQGA